MKNKKLMIPLLLIIIIIGCTLHPKVKPDQAYVRIKPVAPLPEYEQTALPNNLIITIDNVADMGSSYKNTLDLYINKYLIEPDEVYNYKSMYQYNLKLQPGIYNVKAVYYASSGWTEQRYTIKTREKIKVYLNKRTVLTANLKKNWWGALIDKRTYFDVSYEPISIK